MFWSFISIRAGIKCLMSEWIELNWLKFKVETVAVDAIDREPHPGYSRLFSMEVVCKFDWRIPFTYNWWWIKKSTPNFFLLLLFDKFRIKLFEMNESVGFRLKRNISIFVSTNWWRINYFLLLVWNLILRLFIQTKNKKKYKKNETKYKIYNQ